MRKDSNEVLFMIKEDMVFTMTEISSCLCERASERAGVLKRESEHHTTVAEMGTTLTC